MALSSSGALEGTGRQKWKFVTYHVEKDGDHFVVKDECLVYDGRAEGYRSNLVPTGIVFTQALCNRLTEAPEVGNQIVSHCNALRQELDAKGVKVFFDFKRQTGKIYPKWKYTVGAEACSERILDVPAHIMEMVGTNSKYFEEEEYRKWYGLRMQRKREQIISERLAERYPDPPQAPGADESAALVSLTETLLDKSEGLFQLPDRSREFVNWAAELAENLFRQKYGASLPQTEVQSIIVSTLARRFEQRADVLAALTETAKINA